jgi:sugar phosphate isomerase/epimerase
MNFAICNEIYQGWKIEDVFVHAARTGYQGVEISPFTLAENVNELSAGDRTGIRDAAARAGVAIVGLHWLLVKPEGLHLTAPDSALRARTARYFL